jgi:aspartokinase/homoserine dehydrogenase 1
LAQIHQQQKYLLDTFQLDIKVIGIANSKRYLIDRNGIALLKAKDLLKNSDKNMSMSAFIYDMNSLGLPNLIFIDNTASQEVAQGYYKLLRNSVSVVTPNKLASSGSYEHFNTLRETAKKHGVMYLYETNVGAALPVISTLRDLVNSGDKVIRIEAVLSGTLSYIFNTFDGSQPFSQVVKTAKAKGYTEPDPRDDLGCADVARKILILAREAGSKLEYNEVQINGFLPQSCMDAPTVDDFFAELEKNDSYFANMQQTAAKEGKVLRCIARFEDGKATINLQAVDKSHPFYLLSGSDNIIAFTTNRYKERPLIVRGSGAGAEVTAAGVFADIIRVANYL